MTPAARTRLSSPYRDDDREAFRASSQRGDTVERLHRDLASRQSGI